MKRRNLRKKTEGHFDTESASKSSAIRQGGLSFDVEDDEPVTNVVKRRSQKIKLRRPDAQKEQQPTTFQVPSAGDYTDEKLAELKRKTFRRVAQPESVVKVMGNFKPEKRPEPKEAFLKVSLEDSPVEDKREVAEVGDFVPPTSHTIQLAKAKRERLRQAQLAPDYQPSASVMGQTDNKDSDSDDAVDHMRLKFVGRISNKPIVEEEMDLDLIEDEDAVDSFVDGQIKKGIAALGLIEPARPKQKYGGEEGVEERIDLPQVSVQTIREGASSALSSLESAITGLQVAQGDTVGDLDRARSKLAEASRRIEGIKSEEEEVNERYEDVQEMRDYVADLCACLKEKLPFIEEMEDSLLESYDLEATSTILRNETADKEDQAIAEAASESALEVLAADGSMEQASNAAERSVLSTESSFNRPSGESDDLAERLVRRKRRWEGDLYDFRESPLATRLRQIKQTLEEIFADVLPEFSSVRSVLNRFEKFKEKYPKLYRLAYIPDSLSGLLGPFVRCEVMVWSPLCGTELGLESQSWYVELARFGDESEEDLVPEIVKQIVLPAARRQIEKCWSPFERSAVIVEMIKELLVYVSDEKAEMKSLLDWIKQKLVETVGRSGVSPFPRRAMKASETVRAVTFYKFRRSLSLIQSVAEFGDVFGRGFVQEMVMREMVCQKLLPYVRGLVYDKAKAVECLSRLNGCLSDTLLADCPAERKQVTEVIRSVYRSVEKHSKAAEDRDRIEGELSGLLDRFELP